MRVKTDPEFLIRDSFIGSLIREFEVQELVP